MWQRGKEQEQWFSSSGSSFSPEIGFPRKGSPVWLQVQALVVPPGGRAGRSTPGGSLVGILIFMVVLRRQQRMIRPSIWGEVNRIVVRGVG
ncbi:hypothetical protein P170DRAFT_249959 [Aspergillus steynii IBT 23096]|uniref:Uncharacterized protein n=1 Tax=Aspergillus steynii IBT 23096 TaxID=1392250 RepID=A0A2I2FYH4_9EURO|nr:uncharacterized protein P170DRAFT_249959 [Aspergillus steynii IBT 23096]PLB45684.1 hypothetical protein P170DRAFT_249959 [Aspergillus steynii IBT 23096]